ncbi:MAG: hypothetical protein A2W91_16145 [Bacteroidetes bacterium GWF2_38_335]|nr:MAG: hypothetical protein A2W91_16145 [Bacteroidetes bacterium GWF2_38_335]OFY81221.1 MAG: hypothetical protein A2281_07120 [Bacteroidetes bacterium RIFOXYA12_FULL_38_20]HBS85337.1 hypothetical protein [Bacteroidales bacterium]
MKKLLLSLFILTVFVSISNAQLSISYNGTDYTNQEMHFDSIAPNHNFDYHFAVHNGSSSDINCVFHRYDIDKPSTYTHLFCFGVHCFAGTTFTCDEAITAESELDFHPSIILGSNNKSYTFKYTFWDELNPADSVWIYVSHNGVNSIHDINKTDNLSVYPNPSNNQAVFTYDLMGNDGSLVIRNIIGKEVKSVQLNSASGKQVINTSDLPSGTYICSVVVGGKNLKSMKLIVSH